MRERIILVAALSLTVVSFISCDKVNDVSNLDKVVPTPMEERIGRGIFNMGARWDEVEYVTADPSQYTLYHYEVGDTVTESASGDVLDLYCDSVIVGKIVYNSDKTVLYAEGKYGKFELLYDFKEVINQKYGEYDFYNDPYTDAYVPPTFNLYGKYDGKVSPSFKAYHSDDADFDWWWYWNNDEFGGKTITGIGSTAGVLTPVIGKPKPGYTREVLQCYLQLGHKTCNYVVNNNQPVFYPESGNGGLYVYNCGNLYQGYLYYYAPDSPVAQYLPTSFWAQPWVVSKYKNTKK